MFRAQFVVWMVVGLMSGAVGCGEATKPPDDGTGQTTTDAGEDGAQDDGGSTSDTLADSVTSGCGFTSGGNSGPASVSTHGDVDVLDDKLGEAMNQLDGTFRALPDEHRGVLARGPCGTVGVLLRKADPEGAAPSTLEYVALTDGASPAEVVEADAGWFDASLLFDDDCTPIVVRGNRSDGYAEYVREGADQWTRSSIDVDLTDLFGTAPTSLTHRWAERAGDGRLHLVAVVTANSTSQLLHGSRSSAADSAWSFVVLPAPDATELHQLRFGPDGSLHALFMNNIFPCDPCNLDLYHGLLLPGGDSWTTDIVQVSKWGDPLDELANTPSLAIDTDGFPWVAAAFQTRAITGSLLSSELRVYGRTGGEWCSDAVATQSDGYAGSDGTQFTGATSDLRIDDSGRPHVVFSDEAQWHGEQGWANNMRGQVRYAVRAGSTWTVATLFEQEGQTESPQPLVGFDLPLLVVSPDGTQVHVVGTERIWDTDSIYNDTEVPLTLRASAMRATVALP